MLYCPNSSCQTPNDETQKYCQQCGAFLPKQYLWALGDDAAIYKPGEFLMGRYLCKGDRLFLDTQPAQLPEPFQEIPETYSPYLRLAPFRLHVPQVYDVIGEQAEASRQILLLNEAAIADPALHGSRDEDLHLLPSLAESWPTASAFRQLNWLWQIAQLWQPLHSVGAATTLITPDLIRIEGPIVRLLELRLNHEPDLAQLAPVWKSLHAQAKPEIADFLAQLCTNLAHKQIWNAEQLVACLDQALGIAGGSHLRRIELVTQTDQGPTRQRNEDACYPASGSHQVFTSTEQNSDALVIVCDGIGGHQGGDVASGLAIAAVQKRVEQLSPKALSTESTIEVLDESIRDANDLISQRNDSEQRLERQRMGTTLVMGLVHDHQLYVTHVGDSRAYWITRYSCHQITLDDDIASREVRLGYASYRQALQQPIAGSLVQALGMGPSTALHPTVQRFLLDEDSVFLLCSDGLSDFDRIEESWDTVILPIIYGKTAIADVASQLVKIANTRNGHDNVTVGLLYSQVTPAAPVTVPVECATPPTIAQAPPTPITELQPTQVVSKPATPITALSDPTPPDALAAPPPPSTRVVSPSPDRPSVLPLLLGIAALLVLSIGIIYVLLPTRLQLWSQRSPRPQQSPDATPSQTIPSATPDLTALTPELLIKATNPVRLVDAAEEDAEDAGVAPVGSVLRVVQKRALPNEPAWVEITVCSVPEKPEELTVPPTSGDRPPIQISPTSQIPDIPFPDLDPIDNLSTPTPDPLATKLPIELTFLQPSDRGWALEKDVLSNVQGLPSPTFIEQGVCAANASPNTPSPSRTPSPAAPTPQN